MSYNNDQNQHYYDQQGQYNPQQDAQYDQYADQYNQQYEDPNGQQPYYNDGYHASQEGLNNGEYYDPQNDASYYSQGYDPATGAAYDQGYNQEAYYDQPRGGANDHEAFSDFSYGAPNAPGTPGYDSYGTQYTPSQMSYGGPRSSGASTPIYGSNGAFDPSSIAVALPNEPYPAWTADQQAPIAIEQIEDVFIDLTNRFGFQRDSMRNMFDHFMTLLDSRSSRMSPAQALLSLHADYVGGDTANYKKWYFAAQLDLDDEVGFRNMNLGKLSRKARKAKKKSKKARKAVEEHGPENTEETLNALEGDNSLEAADYRWKAKMNNLTPIERVRHVALYLLCWGEANQVRFTSECLCFIYKCALDYLDSPACQQRVEPVPEDRKSVV